MTNYVLLLALMWWLSREYLVWVGDANESNPVSLSFDAFSITDFYGECDF